MNEVNVAQSFEEKYEKALMALEVTILSVYRDEDELLMDYHVDEVCEVLMRRYRAEMTNFPYTAPKLEGLREKLHDVLLIVTELLLGRRELPEISEVDRIQLTPEEVRQCLNRLRKSIKTWSKAGGRQSYLRYVHGMMSGMLPD
jgi:hypothetical protein